MKIELWSDYVCPFCYIGKRRFEEAIKLAGLEEKTEIIYKAFELDPNSPKTSDKTTQQNLTEKYGMTPEEAKRMTDNIVIQAKEVGLEYNFDKMLPANTFDAHRLTKLAQQEGVATTIAEDLMKAHFIDGEEIGDQEVLLQIAEEAGISRKRAEEVLDSEEFAAEVKADITEAGQVGVQGVPFFVINRKYAISGAQPIEIFTETLLKAAAEEA